MRTRTLGRTGVTASEIGFGAWAIGGGWGEQKEEASIAALHRALDLGCTFIDTAAGYGDGHSERVIGKVLKERKEAVFVATKTPPAPGPWPPTPYCRDDERYSESYLRANVEERLRNLGTERIDLLQLHTWTRAWNRNPRPFEVLRKLQAEGKIRFIGLSTPEQDQNSVIDLMRAGWLDAVQVIYNVFEQEPAAELLPVAQETNVGRRRPRGLRRGRPGRQVHEGHDVRRGRLPPQLLRRGPPGAGGGAHREGPEGDRGLGPQPAPGRGPVRARPPRGEHRHPRHPQRGAGRGQLRRLRSRADAGGAGPPAPQARLAARRLVRREVGLGHSRGGWRTPEVGRRRLMAKPVYFPGPGAELNVLPSVTPGSPRSRPSGSAGCVRSWNTRLRDVGEDQDEGDTFRSIMLLPVSAATCARSRVASGATIGVPTVRVKGATSSPSRRAR